VVSLYLLWIAGADSVNNPIDAKNQKRMPRRRKGGIMKLLFLAVMLSGALTTQVFAGEKVGKSSVPASHIGADAVWNAGPSFPGKVQEKCGALSVPELGECFSRVMKESGASIDAIAFARRMENDAWMRAFRDTGRVDIAYVTYPFRANENQGVLLVNGDPELIDVDDFVLPMKGELEKDLVYAGLAKRFPDISFWPGDRYSTEFPVALLLSGGGQRVYVGYVLRNGCHACEEIGSAVFAFDFASNGKFAGNKLMIVTDTTGKRFSDPAVPVTVKPGKEFSLVLDSNRTTGYGWSLDGSVDKSVVKLIGSDYRQPSTKLVGAGGADIFKFRAVRKGKTVVFLRYARSWEKGVEPVRRAAFTVIVR
jgi:predicted secreted protein